MEINDENLSDAEILNEILKVGINFRGTILNECISLEKGMDDYVVNHITQDPEQQLKIFHLLTDRLTFESKRTTLKAIFDKKEDDAGFKKTKNNSYPHSKFFDELRQINDERNYFAHYPLLINENAIKAYPIVGFVNLRDKVNVEWYDENRFLNLIDRIHKKTNEIDLLAVGIIKSTK